MMSASGPDEGFGIGFVMLQIGFDGGFEVGDAHEDIAGWRRR
jgi:hypothetical protein